MSFYNHANSKPCVDCGCLKSNHTYWKPSVGTYSHPCRKHGCPEYKEPEDA